MQLIKIESNTIGSEVKQTVNARDLHAFLEVSKDFSNWMKAQIKRARLIENKDFVVFAQKGVNPSGGRPTSEYHLTIEAGKHISMMSGTEKGYEVRDYFLECEERAKNPLAAIADPSTRALIQLLADTDAIKQEQTKQAQQLEYVQQQIMDVKPRLTAYSINAIQGEISRTAKIYRQSQSVKYIKLSVPESTEYFRLMVLDKFDVADIGYLTDSKQVCKFLRKEAQKYQSEYNAWLDRNSLFVQGGK